MASAKEAQAKNYHNELEETVLNLFLVLCTLLSTVVAFANPPEEPPSKKGLPIRMSVFGPKNMLHIQRGTVPTARGASSHLRTREEVYKPGYLRPEEWDYFKKYIEGRHPAFPAPEAQEEELGGWELIPKTPGRKAPLPDRRTLFPQLPALPGSRPSAPPTPAFTTPAAPVRLLLGGTPGSRDTSPPRNLVIAPPAPPPPQAKPFVTLQPASTCLGDNGGPGRRSCTFMQAARPAAAAASFLLVVGGTAASAPAAGALVVGGAAVRRLVSAPVLGR